MMMNAIHYPKLDSAINSPALLNFEQGWHFPQWSCAINRYVQTWTHLFGCAFTHGLSLNFRHWRELFIHPSVGDELIYSAPQMRKPDNKGL